MRIVIPGLTVSKHALIQHTSDMIQDGTIQNVDLAPNFLSDTKGDVGLGLNKLLTANLALRELASDRLIIEDTASTTTRDLVLATLRSRDIKFENPYANVDTQGGSDSYIAFRYWDGTNWVTAAQLLTPRGFLILNGALCPFRSYSASADVDYVDFTSLDINTHGCYIILAHLTNPTASNSAYYVYVENDYTATNYYSQYTAGNGTTVGAGRLNSSEIGHLLAGSSGTIVLFIMRDPQGYPRFHSFSNQYGATAVQNVYYAGTKTATVTNITSIRIHAGVAGAIGAGSRLMLFRLGG